MVKHDKNNPPKVPDGWVAKYDDEYSTFFYVDLKTKKSQWDAPPGTTFGSDSKGDDVPPPAYSPTGGERKKAEVNRASAPRPAAAEPQRGYSQGPPPQQQQRYQQGPPQGQYYQQGPPPGQYYQQGPPQGYYQQGPPQGYYQQQQQPPRRSNAGNMALGVGGGLLGGMLLGSAINGWEDHERNEGYQDGYQDGYDNGFDNGNDYGGDDFGGGDFGGDF
ncbi:WWM1 WW domain-containing protein WWM1 [Candida maltosa Xu316]